MAEVVLYAELQHVKKELERKSRQLDLITSLALLSTEPGDCGHVIRRCLEIIARANNWVLAQFWTPLEKKQALSCSEWYYASTLITDLRVASIERTFSKGVDLPGRSWSNGFPLVLNSVGSAKGLMFSRASSAQKCGVQSGYAVPIKHGSNTTGILEFFSSEPIELHDSDHLFYDKLGNYVASLLAQRLAEYALRQQDALKNEILDNSESAFVCINEAGLITEWTKQATALLGWEREEALGRTIHDTIIPERYRDAHLRGLVHYMNNKDGPVLNKPVRAPGIHKNGQEIPIELHIFPIESFGLRCFGAFIKDGAPAKQENPIVLK